MFSEAVDNIDKTIGVPYEIVSFYNPDGKDGICKLYNEGARRAKYDLLCFMHEDLNIKTQNWGKIVADAFDQKSNLGIVGVVGSVYKSKAPTGWDAVSFDPTLVKCNYIQGFKFSKQPSVAYYENSSNEKLSNVAVVDGMWFCTTKTVAIKYPFDENLFNGFHCYDLDFCFQVGLTHHIAVTYDVLIEHYSEGSYKRDWWMDTLKLHDKWQKKLPIDLQNLPANTRFVIEKRAYRGIVYMFKEFGYSNGDLLVFYLKEKLKGRMGWQIFFKCNLLVWKHIFGIK